MSRRFFPSSAHTNPAHLSAIGGDFVLESVVQCAAFVRYSEFGGCPLFGSRKCTASTGIAVGTSTVVRYSEEVRYWEGPLSEVPLYKVDSYKVIIDSTKLRRDVSYLGTSRRFQLVNARVYET